MTTHRTYTEILLSLPSTEVDIDWEARARNRQSPAMNIEIAEENLKILHEVFDSISLTHWLCFGTLLGAMRDGRLITHDTDTDIGLYIHDQEKIINGLRLLERRGLLLRREIPNCLLTVMREDEYIDLYLFKASEGYFKRAWSCLSFKFPYNDFIKFKKIRFLDQILLVPSNTRRHLVSLYGKDWKIPKQNCHAELAELPIVSLCNRLRMLIPFRSRFRKVWKHLFGGHSLTS